VVLSGAATIEHIRSNVKALELTLDVEAESELRKLTEPPDVYWEKRGKLSWN
jgi:aryl-alcohol dehydrogenase-like predicted oxidoreductase